MQAQARIDTGELALQIPSQGIDPSWLCGPLDAIEIRENAGITSVRIESAHDREYDIEAADVLARFERFFASELRVAGALV